MRRYAPIFLLGGVSVALAVFALLASIMKPDAATGNSDVMAVTLERNVDVPPPAKRCRQLSESVKAVIEESQYCQADADCVMDSFGCPFGCATAVSAAKYHDVTAVVVEYWADCESFCKYRCPPGSKVVRCVAGRCEVHKEKPWL